MAGNVNLTIGTFHIEFVFVLLFVVSYNLVPIETSCSD